MKKTVPYYRVVRYTDDGCSLYQCLACKGGWEARGHGGWNYCCGCGIKFLGCHESNERKSEKYPERPYDPDATQRAWVLQARQYGLT